jgi:F0F1-type ATP synthase membrane subunit c/vacuolar-type H+-ATPase subunit K
MQTLIWAGAAVTLLGLAGLIVAIRRALAVRKATLPDAETREALQKIVPLNLGSLFLSAIGLMLVVVGILLG